MYHHFRSVMWVKYGMMKNDPTLIYVNSTGAMLGLTYVAIYYAFTLQKVNILLTILQTI